MKYIVFGEGPPARGQLGAQDPDLSKKTTESLKDEKKYGKAILPAHYYATGKFIAVLEFDNPRQMANRFALYSPGVLYTKIYPLIPSEDMSPATQEHQELMETRLKAIHRANRGVT